MFKRQLELYKDLIIKSEELEKDRAKLFTNEQNLLDALNQLEKIQQRMEYRMNWPVGLVLNFYFAWDFRVLNQWETWQRNNKQYIGQWEFQLAQIEVWISGSVYKFNYPETTFAKFSTAEEIRITGMGHPFVQRQKRVVNDVQLNVAENFLIITGPNMAGKSTYLRSLGLAFISANAGFPVLAENCEIPHLKLYSSMRTSDDLTVESSYFHAELTRLRFIMDAIEKGEKVFVILDEILKGTNSKDKEIGSAKFLQKLQRLNSKGVIATHDLSLCNLAEQSISFKNMYFDSTIEGNELAFDYKIRQGICKNMNASFLLKKMNLVDDNSI
jgi:DNA mismatch repair ATPase MutS